MQDYRYGSFEMITITLTQGQVVALGFSVILILIGGGMSTYLAKDGLDDDGMSWFIWILFSVMYTVGIAAFSSIIF